MSRDSKVDGCLEPDPVKVAPAGGERSRITPIIVLSAIPLLLTNWFLAVMVLGRTCALTYAGGNITECAGGLSEEGTTAASGLIALALLVIQIGLIALAHRRIRKS
ncbi:hypothetical protein ACIBEJ_18325 [Nonomuraea sp. NPDC050790]|uniref:hypothetical protein n=1 Tax=Nonomuraea sp. NPDC050790 TaxID=3364371 RepID=UPI00379E84FF